MTKSGLYPWQESAWQQFLAMLQQKRLPHALLIHGPVGIGKLNFAEHMVASLLCLQPSKNYEACGQCHSCQLLKAETHPDLSVVAPEEVGKQIKIDQIRDLKSKQSLTPHVAAYKTVIINPADSMTTSAANSLLKLLEEPQQNTVLLLLSSAQERLPITIRSRCQNLLIKTPERQSAISWLQTQSTEPQVDWESLLNITAGAPLAALSLSEADTSWLSIVDDDFQQLMAGQGNPVEMASRWQNLELIRVLQRLHSAMQNQIKLFLCNARHEASNMTIVGYWQLVDCILTTIKLISSQNNFNKTLLIEDFMVSVKQIASDNKLTWETTTE